MTIRFCIPPIAALLIAGGLHARPQGLTSVEHARIQAQLPARLAQSHARLESFKSRMGLERSGEFRLSASHVDELGQVHARYAQYHQGIRVWGAQAITHMNPTGDFRQDTLALRPRIQSSTQPSLQAGEILAKVQEDLGARGAFATEPKSELVIYPETEQIIHRFMTGGDQLPNAIEAERVVKNYRLAYHVQTRINNDVDGLKHMDYLVDAHTGSVLKRWSSLQTAEPALGLGKSLHNGEVALNTTKIEAGFELRDTTRPTERHPFMDVAGNFITDVHNVPDEDSFTPGDLVTDADNVWGDGANYLEGGSAGNRQTAAVDAAYGLQATWDFLNNVLGRKGIDDKGSSVWGRVHYDKKHRNAFWDDRCFCMTFGDGNFEAEPVKEKSYATLDITAHELGHGVIGKTAKLIYMEECGGLNEANSDIIGTMVEFYTRGRGQGNVIPEDVPSANWVIGEDIYEGGLPMRYMYKPSLDAPIKDGQPVKNWGWFSPDEWWPDLGLINVHLSSGPMNRAFYFLAEGAEVTGDKSAPKYLPNGMTGIGKTNAIRIWYRALATYLTPYSIYVDARAACMRAAQDLTFENHKGVPVTAELAVAAVQNAFAGINVGLTAQATLDKDAPQISELQVTGETGEVTFAVRAQDNTAVTLVEFWVDEMRFESVKVGENGVFKHAFDSSKLKNGVHILTAKAYDAAGNAAYTPSGNLWQGREFWVNNASQEIIQNGGFEQGAWFWEMNRSEQIMNPNNAHSGECYVLLGGFGYQSVNTKDDKKNFSELFQRIQLPATTQNASVKFSVATLTEETGTQAVDYLRVKMESPDGKTVKELGSISNLDASNGYVAKSFPVDPAFVGQGAYLVFSTWENEGNYTAWFVDDVSVSTAVGSAPSLDLNRDRSVDVFDMAVFAHFFTAPTGFGIDGALPADLDGDGVISEEDIKRFMKGF